MKRLFIITGDPSGDFHAGNVVRALKAIDPNIEVTAVGGPRTREAGAQILEDQSRMGLVGPIALLTGAPYHYALGQKILKFLDTFKPDAVLHIDYGVFNLYMAGQIRKKGIPTYYFIPPQVWASRKGRIQKIKKTMSHVFCIFPFEDELYQAEGIPVTYVGHPLLGQLPAPEDRAAFCQRHELDPNRPIIGLFPGSRKMELTYLMQPLVGAVPLIHAQYPDAQFVMAKADRFSQAQFDAFLQPALEAVGRPEVKIIEKQNHALLSVADVVLVASGTVTLEAALYNTPMVLFYKGHPFGYWLYQRLKYLPVIGLPNILTDMNNPIVPELLQDALTPANLAKSALPLLDKNSPESRRAQAGFAEIRAKLGAHNAPEAIARKLVELHSQGQPVAEQPLSVSPAPR